MAAGLDLTLREKPPAAVKDDDIAQALLNAYQQYKRGNYKAAMGHGAAGLNLLAAEHDINGGAWD